MKYEILEHTADAKFRAYGKTLEEAFENVILAFAEIAGRGEKIEGVKKKEIKVKGKDRKSLLYNFIDELVYLLDAEDFVVCFGKVSIKGGFLQAELVGDSAGKYAGLEHVKAATYAEMRISKKSEKRWMIQAVVDI